MAGVFVVVGLSLSLLSQFPHPLNFLPFIITLKVIHTKPLRNLDIEGLLAIIPSLCDYFVIRTYYVFNGGYF